MRFIKIYSFYHIIPYSWWEILYSAKIHRFTETTRINVAYIPPSTACYSKFICIEQIWNIIFSHHLLCLSFTLIWKLKLHIERDVNWKCNTNKVTQKTIKHSYPELYVQTVSKCSTLLIKVWAFQFVYTRSDGFSICDLDSLIRVIVTTRFFYIYKTLLEI